MTGKIFRSTLFVAAVVLLGSLGLVLGVLYSYFDGVQMEQLRSELELAGTAVELNGADYLGKVRPDRMRLTWVSPEGEVLFDTKADPDAMGSHADREEIRQAFETGSGSSIRYSKTLTEKTNYEALRLSDGSVLRISRRHATAPALVGGMLRPVSLVIVVAVALSALLADRMAKRIVRPFNELDYDHPPEHEVYEEIEPMLRRISQQHRQIAAQLEILKCKTDEFDQITANMKEGLVLLDREAGILSMNPAARALFGVAEFEPGQNFLDLSLTRDLRRSVEHVFSHGDDQIRMTCGGREYQVDGSRIQSQGAFVGAALLAYDITDQCSGEQTRREFSANVSHELKTPLQSIIGSAELLEQDLVRPEDTKRFVGYIRKEASRLVNLIEDIIRLSQLDENMELPRETVDLYELAKDTVESLRSIAEAKDVTICLEGEPVCISGVRRLLSEILYNLCDNAVKYNRPGGTVTVRVRYQAGEGQLSVSDTGIGIPPEHQNRVFERFYRVDKSHSKQSGGTGLGLSIVKHAAQYHHARLRLESVPDSGTTITVIFP